MSHEIETMAFTGELPWHGLGNEVSNTMTSSEMLEASGCNWEVQLTQNHYPSDHAHKAGEAVPESYFIERTNDGSILGPYVAGSQYKCFQNKELFDFFTPFIDDGSMFLHTAGALFGGKKVWCMATTNEGFTLGSDDTVVNNLLFTINHTGMEANSALLTPIRVVCNNTMRIALDGANDIVKHNHKTPFDAEAMKVALGMASEQFGEFEKFAKAMAKKVLEGSEELEFFKYVFGGKEREDASGKVIPSEGVRKALAYNRGQEFQALNASNNNNGKRGGPTKQELAEKNEHLARTMQEFIDDIKAGKNIDALKLDQALISEPVPTETVTTETVSDDGKSLSTTVTVSPSSSSSSSTPGVVNPGFDKESARGTLWGGFQTVMFMADHKPVRDYGDDLRLDRAFYGSSNGGNDLKTKATKKALEILEAS